MRTLYFWPIVALMIIFSIGIIIGAFLPASLKLIILEAVADKFQHILSGSTSAWSLSWHIFLNNLFVCSILYIGGFLFIVPLLVIFSNGLMIGVFMSLIYRMDVVVPGFFTSSLASLIPHGIFELSAFFLAGALGLMTVIKFLLPRQIEPHLSRTTVLWQSCIRFVSLVIPLLMVAALVETFISPYLATALLNRSTQKQIDPQLEIQLNAQALAQGGCVLSDATQKSNTFNNAHLGTELSFISNTVYNDESIYDELLQRKNVHAWRQTWQCANTASIRLEVWPAQDWSKKQALLTMRRILGINQINYREYSFKMDSLIIERLTYTLADQRVVQAMTTHGDKTIILTLLNPEVGVPALLNTPGLTEAR